MQAINPRLIYCSITGFGQTGLYANRPGSDFLIQAMGGLMSITGSSDSGPQKVGVAIADLMTGMYASVGILAALHHRDRTGEGQRYRSRAARLPVAMLANQNMNYLVGGKAPGLMGNAHPNIVPYEVFAATADSHLIPAVGNDGQFARFCQLAQREEWITDARFAGNAARVAHRAELIPQIRAVMTQRTTAQWIAAPEAANGPAARSIVSTKCSTIRRSTSRPAENPAPSRDGTAGCPRVANPINFSKTAGSVAN